MVKWIGSVTRLKDRGNIIMGHVIRPEYASYPSVPRYGETYSVFMTTAHASRQEMAKERRFMDIITIYIPISHVQMAGDDVSMSVLESTCTCHP